MLKDPAVQGVVLCTPHTMHTEQIIDAAEGRAPYLVPQDQMIANIAALEAIIESPGPATRPWSS